MRKGAPAAHQLQVEGFGAVDRLTGTHKELVISISISFSFLSLAKVHKTVRRRYSSSSIERWVASMGDVSPGHFRKLVLFWTL